jgi:transglutaminase-like putative cysteine protease
MEYSKEDLSKYLKSTSFCESDSPEIKELAKKIVGEKKGREAAEAIFKWVRDEIAYDVKKIVGAKEVLKRNPPRGICSDKASIFIALCRASNIPARYVVVNYKLKLKNSEVIPALHTIAEVFVDGEWVPADPSFGKSTEKIIEISKFGKFDWKDVKWAIRLRSLSVFFIFFENIFFWLNPKVKKLKNLIKDLGH